MQANKENKTTPAAPATTGKGAGKKGEAKTTPVAPATPPAEIPPVVPPVEEPTKNEDGVTDNNVGEMPPVEPIATWEDVEDTVVDVLMGDLEAIAQNQRIREACYAVVAEYERQIAPKPLSVEEMAAINYNRLVSQYGKDFVTAQKGSNKQYFSRHSWGQMPKDKYGWKEITIPLPELQGK